MTRTRVRWPVIALISLALSAGFLAGRASGGAARPRSEAVRTHVVRPGETLWEIARAEVGATGDPRPTILRIAQINALDGSRVVPGDRLILPVAS